MGVNAMMGPLVINGPVAYWPGFVCDCGQGHLHSAYGFLAGEKLYSEECYEELVGEPPSTNEVQATHPFVSIPASQPENRVLRCMGYINYIHHIPCYKSLAYQLYEQEWSKPQKFYIWNQLQHHCPWAFDGLSEDPIRPYVIALHRQRDLFHRAKAISELNALSRMDSEKAESIIRGALSDKPIQRAFIEELEARYYEERVEAQAVIRDRLALCWRE